MSYWFLRVEESECLYIPGYLLGVREVLLCTLSF